MKMPPTEATPEVPPASGNGVASLEEPSADIITLHRAHDVYNVRFFSHRSVLGWLVTLTKRSLKRLLTPVLLQQADYNAANTRVTSHLWRVAKELGQQQAASLGEIGAAEVWMTAALRKMRADLEEQITRAHERQAATRKDLEERIRQVHEHHVKLGQGLADQAKGLSDQLTSLTAKIDQTLGRLRSDLIVQERRVTNLLTDVRKSLPEPLSAETLQKLAEQERHALDPMFISLEDTFRGTRDEIKDRLRVYLPIVQEALGDLASGSLLDIGCGRGEWLELLNEQALRPIGIDLNGTLIEECRAQGLDVVCSDAIAYLRTLPARSVAVITGFHIVEHLAFDALVQLLDEAVRVLRPGGLAIFETPNPENVLVGSYAFYLDPSHRSPLPSATLQFLVEARGFCHVEVLKLHPFPESMRIQGQDRDFAERFNEYFYGPRDYAVIGRKA